MTDLRLVALVASASSPTRTYEVKTDGRMLSCPCPGWTQRTHTRRCNAVLVGGSCDCRHAHDPKPLRTCRHVREVDGRVRAAGGLVAVLRLLDSGTTLSDSEAVRRAHRRAAEHCSHCGAARAHWQQLPSDDAARGPVVPVPDMAWLGGGRAILLRD